MHSSRMALDRSVTEGLVSSGDRVEIINGLWKRDYTITSLAQVTEWDAYCHLYASECKKAVQYGYGEHITIRKQRDIQTVANELENGFTKEEIKRKLLLLDTRDRPEDIKNRMAEGSVRLVVRLFSMIDIGPVPHDRFQGRAPLLWDNEQVNLKFFLQDHFMESSSIADKTKFEEDFTALNIQRFTGLQIQWTNNLVDHLRLIENDTILCIFHHATFLKYQDNHIFPAGFIEETLQTLALLFPRYDRATQKWLKSERASSADDAILLDLGLLNCNRLMSDDRRLDRFKFWRDELVTLKEKFEQPRPSSIVHFWYDRRNRAQWYTFWVAILILCLTVFFGMVQSIEGALQVYKAYHPTPVR